MRWYLYLLFVILFVLGCSDKGTSPEPPDVLLSGVVKNTNGQIIVGAQIIVDFEFDFSIIEGCEVQNSMNQNTRFVDSEEQLLYFAAFDSATYEPFPVYLGDGEIAQDGWLVHIVCAGDDAEIDPPVLGYSNPDKGMPSGDDFLADLVQNEIESFYFNGESLGYPGTFHTTVPLKCLAGGAGSEPVINVGDNIYLRAFNASNLAGALWYSDMLFPHQVYDNNGQPYTLWNIRFFENPTIPVELLSFTGNPGDGFVVLEWVTASEDNCSHFNIYRDEQLLVDINSKGSSSYYSYIDSAVINGYSYYYQLTAVDVNGVETEVLSELEVIPSYDPSYVVTDWRLHQNYPNPCNDTTIIEYDVLQTSSVTVSILDADKNVLDTPIENEQKVGPLKHGFSYSTDSFSSGIYYIEYTNPENSWQKKMFISKNPITMTNASGQYNITSLPLGEEIELRDELGGDMGSGTISYTVSVHAEYDGSSSDTISIYLTGPNMEQNFIIP